MHSICYNNEILKFSNNDIKCPQCNINIFKYLNTTTNTSTNTNTNNNNTNNNRTKKQTNIMPTLKESMFIYQSSQTTKDINEQNKKHRCLTTQIPAVSSNMNPVNFRHRALSTGSMLSPTNRWTKASNREHFKSTSIAAKLSAGKLNQDLENKLALTGNMFYTRTNWSFLNGVPIDKQNTIHIRIEDDGPYGR
jgi:hypothetical protein